MAGVWVGDPCPRIYMGLASLPVATATKSHWISLDAIEAMFAPHVQGFSYNQGGCYMLLAQLPWAFIAEALCAT